MFFYCYDLLGLFFLIFASPYYFYRMMRVKKYRAGFRERFGRLDESKLTVLQGRKVCWIHAVSVGEVGTVDSLVKRLKQENPERAIVLSTVTDTGQQQARAIKEADVVLYLPLDLGPIVKKVLRRIRPEVFVIVETELWPRLLSVLKHQGVRILLINGRISDRSYHRYLWTQFLWHKVLGWIDRIAMQSQVDAERIIQMGADSGKVVVTGNMKFDRFPEALSSDEIADLRNRFGLREENRLWIAGSTHPGEEEIILKIYSNLRSRFSYLRLLLAPRHPERKTEVEQLIRQKGFSFLSYRSGEAAPPGAEPVIHLDTTGYLLRLYSLSDYVFIGKSLQGRGGQNPLEPAVFSKPVVFGPHMENFREAAGVLLENQAAIQVQDEAELEKILRHWLENPDVCRQLGHSARQVLEKHRGATDKNLELILGRFDPRAD